ncbi:phosphoglycolate phosphatase [Anaerohalosphaera lusitana]|uniref:phosphoglycolate phosphatase n=1 Tax=Anaerohalosphaera lusitana TaxID=1936003 RepID=A0A1U9NLE8_9BACT|nr:HAD hydrolase-like protein [Anaerohalosphaera lusitana]AQT68627.1 phosphoglycolate phosphatase [Anaerohalosphaera lusitana]
MSDHTKELREMKPTSDYLVAIDSDGCVFDAMGIKQRECFCPMLIAHFGLQPVAEAARDCKDFADLFSKTRGANRHKTAVRILTELLPSHPMVKERGFDVPNYPHYVQWVNEPDSLLSDAGLKKAIAEERREEARKELEMVLKWSQRVNEMVAEVVKNVPPFPYVRESLEKIEGTADIIVCSSTPTEALKREWAEHGVAKYVKVIAGQEMGKKEEHLAVMCEKYDKDKIIMMGDAPGDMKAAKKNDVMFYAINPGAEAMSWKRFHDEAFDKFMAGEYAGQYEQMVIDEFDEYLPENPPWMAV